MAVRQPCVPTCLSALARHPSARCGRCVLRQTFRTRVSSRVFCAHRCRKPRTEWGCQPVALMIVAIVVPWGSLSKASTASCFVPPPTEAEGMLPGLADLFATLLARAILVFEGLLLCDIGGSFDGNGTQRRHHRSPAMAPSPAGQDP